MHTNAEDLADISHCRQPQARQAPGLERRALELLLCLARSRPDRSLPWKALVLPPRFAGFVGDVGVASSTKAVK